MSEQRGVYTPDPYEQLRGLIGEEEAAWLVRLIHLVNSAGGWGKIEITFKRSRMIRPIATVSAGEDDCSNL